MSEFMANRPYGARTTSRHARQAMCRPKSAPGADYRNTALNDNNANSCRELCAKDAACLAWTWVKPGVQNPKAMCWLKNAVSPSHPNANTTSGIKVTSTAVH